MPEFKPGEVFVNHRIEGLAGRGGMGVVYRARDLDLDRVVALKVIAPALAEEPDFRARFVAESKAAASIEHPHVIPVYYAGEREGELFIVMRYVDGPDLRALVRAEGRLDPERAAHIVAQVGGALDAAHAHGLVHRDVKPANVLLGADDHAYLTDFGLTKREASTGGVSRVGGWVGTLGFVAPEQIRGERVDARTDVYALGCVLVHALTGGAPYLRESDEATLWAHLNAPPPVDTVPREFAGVVERALSKDPGDRYPSAGDLGRAALAAAGRSAPPGPERVVARGAAAPDGTPQTAPTWRVSMRAHEGETHVSPPDGAGGGGGGTGVTALAPVSGPGPGRAGVSGLAALARRRSAQVAAAGVLVAGALVAILLVAGGDDDKAGGETVATATTAVSRETRAGRLRPTSSRPNAITIANGRAWAMSQRDGTITILDAKTGKLQRRIGTRPGGTAIDASGSTIWALKGFTRVLLRISAKSGKRIGRPIELKLAGLPISIAAGKDIMWVGARKRGERDGSGEYLMKIDTRLREPGVEAVTIPYGVQDVALGEGGVWVSTTTSDVVWQVDPNDPRKMQPIRVGAGLDGIAVGEGAVWVVEGANKGIARINPRTRKVDRRLRLGVVPTKIAVGGGSVWVTSKGANRLFRIDPRKVELRETLDTGSEPFAIAVKGNAVWVTLLDESGGGVQRFGFYP